MLAYILNTTVLCADVTTSSYITGYRDIHKTVATVSL